MPSGQKEGGPRHQIRSLRNSISRAERTRCAAQALLPHSKAATHWIPDSNKTIYTQVSIMTFLTHPSPTSNRAFAAMKKCLKDSRIVKDNDSSTSLLVRATGRVA
eukprot:scaffold2142_cov327-Pavlova_lutheri.AAC.7